MNEDERSLNRYNARLDEIARAKARGDAFLARAERQAAERKAAARAKGSFPRA
jgi:hypothetical protein